MRITVDKVLPAEFLEAAWLLHNLAFDELRTESITRHVMFRNEFEAVMADERVWKYRGIDESDPTAVPAMATFTNDLSTVPLVSLEFFEHRWPELYSGQRIWYIGFFAIDPDHRGSGVFEQVIAHMWRAVTESDGIAMLDICRRNDRLGLPTAIHQTLLSLTPEMTATTVDEQTYWLYALP
jgi:hypothetical protein